MILPVALRRKRRYLKVFFFLLMELELRNLAGGTATYRPTTNHRRFSSFLWGMGILGSLKMADARVGVLGRLKT